MPELQIEFVSSPKKRKVGKSRAKDYLGEQAQAREKNKRDRKRMVREVSRKNVKPKQCHYIEQEAEFEEAKGEDVKAGRVSKGKVHRTEEMMQ